MIIIITTSMLDLVLPHFGLGLGIGIIDSRLTLENIKNRFFQNLSLMPLLALLVERRHVAQYGSVYAIGIYNKMFLPFILTWKKSKSAQTAVALAYSLGPLTGGYLVQSIGFKVICIHQIHQLVSHIY